MLIFLFRCFVRRTFHDTDVNIFISPFLLHCMTINRLVSQGATVAGDTMAGNALAKLRSFLVRGLAVMAVLFTYAVGSVATLGVSGLVLATAATPAQAHRRFVRHRRFFPRRRFVRARFFVPRRRFVRARFFAPRRRFVHRRWWGGYY
jgi:hypothetical protein